MSLRRRIYRERQLAWRVTKASLLVGIALLIILLLSGGFRYGEFVLRSLIYSRGGISPSRFRVAGLLRGLAVAAMIASGSIALYGPAVWIEDAEVRSHQAGPDPHGAMMEPFSANLYIIILLGILLSIYIAARALYFLIF